MAIRAVVFDIGGVLEICYRDNAQAIGDIQDLLTGA